MMKCVYGVERTVVSTSECILLNIFVCLCSTFFITLRRGDKTILELIRSFGKRNENLAMESLYDS